MSKLLKCPFCGGEARLYGNSKPIGARLKHYQVAVCTNADCGCRTSPCETVEDAIYKWNCRTPMANIVEKLRELKMRYFLTIANTGDDKNDFAYENVGNALDNAINIVKQEIENGLE